MSYSTFSRTSFLTRTGIGLLGVEAAFSGVLNARPVDLKRDASSAEHVIYLYMQGGMSHIDTLDPKAKAEDKGPGGRIRTNTDEVISSYFPKLAKQMDQVALFRSLHSKEGSHERGNYLMHTNFRPLATENHPSLGAWVLKLLGQRNQTLPGWVRLGRNPVQLDAGFFGNEYMPLTLNNIKKGIENSSLPQEISKKRFDKRLQYLNEHDKAFMKRYGFDAVSAHEENRKDAIKLMFSTDLKAFDLSHESQALIDMYGNNTFGQSCLLARRLVQSGVRFVEVNSGGWDMHNELEDRLETKCMELDKGLNALLLDLRKRKLLDKTIVVLATEFGRTPKLQGDGRGHYPKAFSGLLAGGRIKGGVVIGETDKNGAKIIKDPVSTNDFNATIVKALGIDPSFEAKSNLGRPINIAGGGKAWTNVLS